MPGPSSRTTQRLIRPFHAAPSHSDIDVPWKPLNVALTWVLDVEASIARRVPMPIGTSIIVVAEKVERR